MGPNAASASSAKPTGRVNTRNAPFLWWPAGSGVRRASSASASPNQSMQPMAVAGSLMPGERARTAISVNCRAP